MTGWGQDGPIAHTAGHDIDYIAVTGALHAIGRAGGPPQVPLNLLGDFAAGSMFLVTGVLAALLEARASGRGQVVDAAIVDGAAVLSTMVYGLHGGGFVAGRAWRQPPRHRGAVLRRLRDGRRSAHGGRARWSRSSTPSSYGCSTPEPDLPDRHDIAAWPQLRERFAAAFRTKTMARVVGGLRRLRRLRGAGRVARRGAGTTRSWRPGARSSPRTASCSRPRRRGSPALRRRSALPPSAPGADTRAALTDWGIDDVDALLDAKVVIQR